jgi:hypothetical protein
VARNGIVFHNLSGQEIRDKIRDYLTEERKGFGQKLQDILKDEISGMEKKEKEEKISAPSSS